MNQVHQTLNTYYDNFGGGWGWRGWGGWGDGFRESTTTEDTYTVGALVVDLFDSHTKKLIWRGSDPNQIGELTFDVCISRSVRLTQAVAR